MQKVISKKNYFNILFAVNFLITFAFGMNDALFSIYYKGYNANIILLGLVFSLYAFSKMITMPVTGKLLDKYGASNVLLSGLLLYTIVSALLLYVRNPFFIIYIRVLQGIACALYRPAVFYIIGNTSHGSFRGKTLGTFDISFYSALAIAPFFGGVLKRIYGFNCVFQLMLICCIGAVILLLVSRTVTTNSNKLSKQYNKKQINKYSLALVSHYIYIFARSWGVTCTVIFLPLYMQNIGYNESRIGLVLSTAAAIMALSLPFTGRLADNMCKENLVFTGGAVTSLCIIAISYLSSIYFIILLMCISGFFSALSQPACSSMLIEITDERELGVVIGIFNFAMGLGAIIGAFCSSLIFQHFSIHAAFTFAGILGVFTALFYHIVLDKFYYKISYQ